MKHVLIINNTHPLRQAIQARYCSLFLCRLKGLMFQKVLGRDEGLLMVQARADRVDSSIHMMFMNFDLAVIWLDANCKVVDARHCRRWNPAYFPSSAAKFVLETHVDHLTEFQIGDQVIIQPCES